MPTRTVASQIRSGSVTLSYVRFGSISGHLQCNNVMSALTPKADVCGALPYVR